MLTTVFFPATGETDLSDLPGTEYPEPILTPDITGAEIHKIIKMAAPHKASDSDGIPNYILQLLADIMIPHLTILYNSCLRQGYHPHLFRQVSTMALRKPGKSA